jgi:hypothetical protein
MPTLISKPTRIEAAGNKPKLIDEYIGRVNSKHCQIGIAHMRSPGGWVEPGQKPGKRSRGEGDNRAVGARDGDGHSAAIVAVGNTGRCPCFNADYAGLGRRLSARVSLLGVATPDRTTGCVGVSARRALRS